MMKGNKSDRFILSRSAKRDEIIDKYNVASTNFQCSISPKGLSFNKSPSSEVQSSLSQSLSKKYEKRKLYNTLLKNQLFKTVKRKKTSITFLKKKTNRDKDCIPLIEDDLIANQRELVNIHEDSFNNSFSIFEYLSDEKKEKPSLVKVLDAPELMDDFYLHILSWSNNDIIAVALGERLFFLDNKDNRVSLLKKYRNVKISSCKFMDDPSNIAIGLENGYISLCDTVKYKEYSLFQQHVDRASVIETIPFENKLFTTSSRKGEIKTFDTRIKNMMIDEFIGHKQEVCGLKWSPDGRILASGSNDNKLFLWKMGYHKPYHIFNQAHSSAIRALDWSTKKYNFLATGGGIQDRQIKIWNCSTMEMINSVDSGSQVCNLVFSKDGSQILSTHGYSDNSINLWSLDNEYKTLKLKDSLNGHKNRVLYLACSPNNRTIVTGSGDETLRLWNVFASSSSCKKRKTELEVANLSIR